MQGNMGKYTPSVGEGHITILPWHYSAIIAGTWVFTFDGSSWWYGDFRNSSYNQNDQVDYKVYLDVGTYTFVSLHLVSSASGILTLLIDAVSVGTIDLYSGSSVYNTIKTITGISITTPGLKTLSCKVATKNASSSNYYMTLLGLSLFRTA
jgi:hypothetical protein